MQIVFDQSRLSAKDIIDFQRETGIAFSDGAKMLEQALSGSGFLDEGVARAMAGLIWIAKRKEDPEFTYADALEVETGDIEGVPAESNPLEDGPERTLLSEQEDLNGSEELG